MYILSSSMADRDLRLRSSSHRKVCLRRAECAGGEKAFRRMA